MNDSNDDIVPMQFAWFENNCFIISCLQSLFSLDAFCDYLDDVYTKITEKNLYDSTSLLCNLSSINHFLKNNVYVKSSEDYNIYLIHLIKNIIRKIKRKDIETGVIYDLFTTGQYTISDFCDVMKMIFKVTETNLLPDFYNIDTTTILNELKKLNGGNEFNPRNITLSEINTAIKLLIESKDKNAKLYEELFNNGNLNNNGKLTEIMYKASALLFQLYVFIKQTDNTINNIKSGDKQYDKILFPLRSQGDISELLTYLIDIINNEIITFKLKKVNIEFINKKTISKYKSIETIKCNCNDQNIKPIENITIMRYAIINIFYTTNIATYFENNMMLKSTIKDEDNKYTFYASGHECNNYTKTNTVDKLDTEIIIITYTQHAKITELNTKIYDVQIPDIPLTFTIKSSNVSYQLKALSRHTGTTNAGHYFMYKHYIDNKWFKIDPYGTSEQTEEKKELNNLRVRISKPTLFNSFHDVMKELRTDKANGVYLFYEKQNNK